MLARSLSYLETLRQRIPNTHAYEYDATELDNVDATFQAIRQDLGPVMALLYNAGGGVFKNVEEASLDDFEANWRINVQGLVAATKAVLPQLREHDVANVVIDGLIDMPRNRKRHHDKPDGFFIKPAAVAEAIWTLCHQDPSTWTSELDIRPFGEHW